jgi:hypothetical protein
MAEKITEQTFQASFPPRTLSEMDALISWNLKHLSNLKKMEMINGINMKEGYFKRLELITPMEVSDEGI